MIVDKVDAVALEELIASFPIRPIEDDDSYEAAIAILDRLFILEGRRTKSHLDYFHALAEVAFEYEWEHGVITWFPISPEECCWS